MTTVDTIDTTMQTEHSEQQSEQEQEHEQHSGDLHTKTTPDASHSALSVPAQEPMPATLHRSHESHHHVHWEDFVKASASTMALRKEDRKPSKVNLCRAKLVEILDSIWWQTTVLLFIIADLIIGLTAISILHGDTLTIILLYAAECVLRIFSYGPIRYFSSRLDILDFLAVVACILLYVYGIVTIYPLLVKILRWLSIIRTSYRAIFSKTKKIQTAIRHLHRPNLRGYRDDKYDLDIAYITDHILIMSRPAASTINQFSHDALSEVKSFLDEKHKGNYRIYDLCVYNDSGQDQCPTIVIPKNMNRDDSLPAPSPSPRPNAVNGMVMVESHENVEKSMTKSHLSLHSHHSHHDLHGYEIDLDHSRDIGQKEPDALRPNRPNKKSIDMDANASMMSLFPIGMQFEGDAPNAQYDLFGNDICNEFAFRSSGVLPLEKLFQFAEKSTMYADDRRTNVIIIQSTNGGGRCMFMCACLLFYYYPSASLSEIMKFILNERQHEFHKRVEYSHSHPHEHDPHAPHPHDDHELEDDLFRKFLPSQTRYLQYFATLILHCYREAASHGEVDPEIQELERNLSEHIQQIHHHHQMMTLMDQSVLNAYSKIEKSKWNFYHEHAQDLLSAKIGVVIKQIGIYNYYEVIDPFVRWQADVFQWVKVEDEQAEDGRYQRIDYDVYTWGEDHDPGKNSAIIRRGQDVPARVIEQDFGIRIYKCVENRFADERKIKRKLKAQLILHSHFLNLDEDHRITFRKSEIDFVAKDTHHRHFPKDFHIVIEARILKKKC